MSELVCKRYLGPIKENCAGTLIMGCTHYPVLEDSIHKILPGVTLINTGIELAKVV